MADDQRLAESPTADGIGWARIVVGSLFLLLAVRQWRNRPAQGASRARCTAGREACKGFTPRRLPVPHSRFTRDA